VRLKGGLRLRRTFSERQKWRLIFYKDADAVHGELNMKHHLSPGARETWSFDPYLQGDEARAACVEKFLETLHINLRMVDTSDFMIAYESPNPLRNV
jgi:hypothetical protein